MTRKIKLFTTLGSTFSAFCVSDNVIPINSDPPYENMTTSRAEKIAPYPLGKKPPNSIRFCRPVVWAPGMIPNTIPAPNTINTIIIPILIAASQNSNSP
ncbi:hypothetical protein D3C81_1588290 [compost metagenome]